MDDGIAAINVDPGSLVTNVKCLQYYNILISDSVSSTVLTFVGCFGI